MPVDRTTTTMNAVVPDGLRAYGVKFWQSLFRCAEIGFTRTKQVVELIKRNLDRYFGKRKKCAEIISAHAFSIPAVRDLPKFYCAMWHRV